MFNSTLLAFMRSFGMDPETLKTAALEAVAEIQKFKKQIDGMDLKLDEIQKRSKVLATSFSAKTNVRKMIEKIVESEDSRK